MIAAVFVGLVLAGAACVAIVALNLRAELAMARLAAARLDRLDADDRARDAGDDYRLERADLA